MVPLPCDQDIEGSSDLMPFAVVPVPVKEKCCEQTMASDSFILHTAAHRMSTDQTRKCEGDVCSAMIEVVQEKSSRGRMLARKCSEYLKAFPESSKFTSIKEFHANLVGGPS